MPSLPIWLPALVALGTAIGIVLAHLEFVRARTSRQGAMLWAAVVIVAAGVVIAGTDRLPVAAAIGFVLIPVATALAVGMFRAERLQHQS